MNKMQFELTKQEHEILYWAIRGYIESKELEIKEAHEYTPQNDFEAESVNETVKKLREIEQNAILLGEKLALRQYGYLNYYQEHTT